MKYTQEQIQFLKDNVKGTPYKELTKMFNEKYGTEQSDKAISSTLKRNNLQNGLNGEFKKGLIPHNKGKKMSPEVYEKVKETMFKKGNIPHNHVEVGSERITKDGYIEVKVAEPNKWKLKHRHVWEQKHGKLGKSECLIFKDQDKTNCDIDNLMKIKRAELLIMTQNGMFSNEKEHTEVYANIAKLVSKTRKVKKGSENNQTGHRSKEEISSVI